MVKQVETPTIPLPDFIERGNVVKVQSDVVAENYLWTYNLPKVDMQLTQLGLVFPEKFELSTNTDVSHSFYFNKIGTSTIGL